MGNAKHDSLLRMRTLKDLIEEERVGVEMSVVVVPVGDELLVLSGGQVQLDNHWLPIAAQAAFNGGFIEAEEMDELRRLSGEVTDRQLHDYRKGRLFELAETLGYDLVKKE